MLKFTKIFLIMVVVLFLASSVYAIDMNITPSFDNSTIEEGNNTSLDENNLSDNTVEDDIIPESLTPTPRVTTTTTVPEASLGLSNILNILLIVVGIVLVLLAVAILIRLKG